MTSEGQGRGEAKMHEASELSSELSRPGLEVAEIADISQIPDTDTALSSLRAIFYQVCVTTGFLSQARRQVLPSFDRLRAAVRAHRPLQLLDLAKFRLLLPHDVLFEYADASLLDPDLAGQDCTPVLVFDFVDGVAPLKRKRASLGSARALSAVQQLIAKRLAKFDDAVAAFRGGLDPADALRWLAVLDDRATAHVPVSQPLADPIDVMVANSSTNGPAPSSSSDPISIFIDDVTGSPHYCNQIVPGGRIVVPAREPKFGHVDDDLLSPGLRDGLRDYKNIHNLYSHQVHALQALHNGNHVMVATSTSSGKSLVYQLPVLDAIANSSSASALYIFPTKALAQDQKQAFDKLAANMPHLAPRVLAHVYDGDTPRDRRRQIRSNANVIFTNPDMIHHGILPSWDTWRPFLRSLKFIVVDELHVYSGLFGAHVSFVMRRLLRLCTLLGNPNVQVISCSATVRYPRQLMADMFGLEGTITKLDEEEASESSRSEPGAEPCSKIGPQSSIDVISEDGSPCGKRTFIFWNCPYISPNDPNSGRVHPVGEASRLMIELVSRGIRTIAFCKVRRACEFLMKSIHREISGDKSSNHSDLLGKVMSYRGGYSAQDRRKIEKQMFNGKLLGIIATNALELGIDIGSLDAVLLVGFPITISSFRQQCGRVGRRNNHSLVIVIGSGQPMDQTFMQNPKSVFDVPDVDIPLGLDNALVLESHLQCAAEEYPVSIERDAKYFRSSADDSAVWDKKWKKLVTSRLLPYEITENDNEDLAGSFRSGIFDPFSHVAIRGDKQDEFAVVDVTDDRKTVLETIEAERMSFSLYEGGIFLHQGLPYLVIEVNTQEKYARVRRVDVEWITRQRDYTDVDPIETELVHVLMTGQGAFVPRQRVVESPDNYTACFGRIRHTTIVFGFFKVDRRDQIIDAVSVDCPPVKFETKGFWIDVPAEAIRIVKEKDLSIAAGIHGAEHAILNLFPRFVTTLPNDVNTECKAPQKEYAKRASARKRPARLIFCDRRGGDQGSGISHKAFHFVEELIVEAIKRIEQCECDTGCEACAASPTCREQSEIISKFAALIILKVLAGQPIDLGTIPNGPEANLKRPVSDTVVPANFVPVAFVNESDSDNDVYTDRPAPSTSQKTE